jgi:hypothetical protein
MTYGQLAEIKTTGFNLNHIIDDVVNNARFSFGKQFKNQPVSEYDQNKINEWAAKEGVAAPSKIIKSTVESKLAEMGAAVEVTFISSQMFSIASEDLSKFESAKSILALANQKLESEDHDAECGHFAYYNF